MKKLLCLAAAAAILAQTGCVSLTQLTAASGAVDALGTLWAAFVAVKVAAGI